MKKLILASASPTRRELLGKTGLTFETVESGYIEDISLPMAPEVLATHLSRGKAETVASKYKQSIILGADTIIVYENKILGKPHTGAVAKEMLQMLSGKQHSAITGFTVIDTENKRTVSRAVETKVVFRELSEKEIDDYIDTGEPLDKAGAYAILELGGKFVKTLKGSKSNVAGLPMSEVMETLKDFGIF